MDTRADALPHVSYLVSVKHQLTAALLLLTCVVLYGQTPDWTLYNGLRDTTFYSRVANMKLVSFKSSDTADYKIPEGSDGVVQMDRMTEVMTPPAAMQDSIVCTLVYCVQRTGEREQNVMMCYEPRNAIFFEDAAGRIIGYVEICFACLRMHANPEDIFLAWGDEQYDILKSLFIEAGITWGTLHTEYDKR